MRLRSRITWVIGIALAALLVVAGLDALRSKSNRRSLPTSATVGIVSTPTEELGSSPAIRQYVLRASAICTEASSDLPDAPFGPVATLEEIAAWNSEAARAGESSLRQLQALPPPREADRALLERFSSQAADEIGLLRQAAAAASAGEERHLRALSRKRVDATHRKHASTDQLSARWGLDDLEILRACPVVVPA
jgi:hypothetical protein